jgi:transcriptional regulator with XRE-family HTH domain
MTDSMMPTRNHPRLRDFRRQRKLSQDELGFRCRISQARISRAERGYVRLSDEEASRISAELGVPTDVIN